MKVMKAYLFDCNIGYYKLTLTYSLRLNKKNFSLQISTWIFAASKFTMRFDADILNGTEADSCMGWAWNNLLPQLYSRRC